MSRQVQLRRGSTTLDLGETTYKLVAGSWASGGPQLEVKVIVEATTLSELRRDVAAIRQMLNQAQHYAAEQVGSAVYVYTKVCDNLTTTAELGATWLRKLIMAGSVAEPDASTFANGRYALTLIVSLETEETWQRAAVEPILAGTSSVTVRSGGGITSNGAAVTGRRLTWTSTTGVTVRVHWIAAAANCQFFAASTRIKAHWDNAAARFKMQDNAGTPNVAQSAVYTLTVGAEYDLVFRWSPGVGMAIWINGVADGTAAACTFAQADTYTIFTPTGSQSLTNCQIWPAVLTDVQCAGLYAWGRPEPELAFYVPPADTKNTNAAYKLYNVPGEADARLRLLLSDATQAYDKFRVGIRPLRIQTTTLWECESGTNGTDVLDAADATASGGNVAQFTPTLTTSVARSTVVLAANPADVAAFYGQYRLLLAVKDNAASVGINLIKWRLTCAGTAEDYSDEYSAAAVATYSLLDLGTLTLPPGAWPEETESCATDVHAGSYLTLEIAVRNTVGSGGGTLNLDAVYLQPVELEGVVECANLTTAQFMALDFASQQQAAVGVADVRSLEYAHWGEYTGDELALAPVTGDAGLLMVFAYRNTTEQMYPNDAVTVYPFVRPGWL